MGRTAHAHQEPDPVLTDAHKRVRAKLMAELELIEAIRDRPLTLAELRRLDAVTRGLAAVTWLPRSNSDGYERQGQGQAFQRPEAPGTGNSAGNGQGVPARPPGGGVKGAPTGPNPPVTPPSASPPEPPPAGVEKWLPAPEDVNIFGVDRTIPAKPPPAPCCGLMGEFAVPPKPEAGSHCLAHTDTRLVPNREGNLYCPRCAEKLDGPVSEL